MKFYKKASSIRSSRKKNYEHLPHSTYSPDVAPCDYDILPNLCEWGISYFGQMKMSSLKQTPTLRVLGKPIGRNKKIGKH